MPPFVTILGRPNHAAITPAFSELEHPSHSQRFLALRLAYAHAEQKSPDRGGGDDCDLFKYPTVFATHVIARTGSLTVVSLPLWAGNFTLQMADTLGGRLGG